MKSDYTKYLDKIYRREKNNARAKAKRLLKKYEGNGLTVVMDERFACTGDWRTNRWDVNRPTWIEEKDDLLGNHTARDWIEALEMLETYISAIGTDIDQRTVPSMLYEERLELIMKDDTHEYRLTWVAKSGAHHLMTTSRLEDISDKIVKLYKQRIEATAFNSVTGEKVGAVFNDGVNGWNYFCECG